MPLSPDVRGAPAASRSVSSTGSRTPSGTTTRAGWLLGSIVVLALAVLASVLLGSRGLDLRAILEVLTGAGDVEARAILLEQRLPRTVLAVAGGAALAVAGVLVQGHTRNPLADPGLLGVTAGASVLVVVAIAFLGVVEPSGYVWFALAGASAAMALVTLLGRFAGGRRDSSPATLVLAGSAVSSVLAAVSGIILLLSTSTLDLFRFYTVGSLSGVHDLVGLTPAFVCIVLGLGLAIGHASTLDALTLGDDTARSLGRNLRRSRLVGLAAITLLTAGAVLCCGSLGFIGLVVPHLVRFFVGIDHRWLIPVSAVVGAVVVLVADTLGRMIVRPAELPVGIVVALVGAPIFVAIVVRSRGSRRVSRR